MCEGDGVEGGTPAETRGVCREEERIDGGAEGEGWEGGREGRREKERALLRRRRACEGCLPLL